MVSVFGGQVVRAGRLMHGKTSSIEHVGASVFAGLPAPCEVGRYHSLIAAPQSLPPQLRVSARTAEGEIMAVRHRTLMVDGVQFHPESVLTPAGPLLLGNFLNLAGGTRADDSFTGAGHAVSE
jgi:anthranilate synthase/aminodeoxychorismate synthase-like glutamine amidotransferase